MKFLAAQVAAFVRNKTARRNFRLLLRYSLLLLALITIFSVLFHVIMEWEGQEHSWLTGFYWTLTVMTTLGFGDITFDSDLGRTFSMIVMLSGVLFLLIVFPFTFIHFFYQPWLQAQDRARTPREVPPEVKEHFIVAGDDGVVASLVHRLRSLDKPWFLMVPDAARALELAEDGMKVVVGAPDDPEAWKAAGVTRAHAVVAAADDHLNSNITFTVRELTASVPVVALARSIDSVDLLELAGASRVVHLPGLLGGALARRAYGGKTRATPAGTLDGLFLAEAPMMHSSLVGMTLGEAAIGHRTGATVVGVWERGGLTLPHRDTPIHDESVIVLAGTEEKLEAFEALAGRTPSDLAPVLVIGGGRVGRAVAEELVKRGLDYCIVDKEAARLPSCDRDRFILGSAADLATLERAGIRQCPTVIITTRDDATNVYLTIYCRRLRPDVQIIARANLDRNVSTLHRAGANLVMSYASLGASAILSFTDSRSALHIAEGLEIFRCDVPKEARRVTLAESGFREKHGCNVVAISRGDERIIAPRAFHEVLPGDSLIVVGTPASRRMLEVALEGADG